MEQVIYGDLLFFINFSMDFLTLYLSARLLHLSPAGWRMTLSAAIGGVYGVVSVLISVGTVVSLALHLAVSILMCTVALRPHRLLHLAKSVALFYGIGFLMGGSMTALYHLLNTYLDETRIFYAGNYETLQENPGFRMVVLLAAVSAVLVFVLARLFFSQGKQKTATLSFGLEGKEVTVTALCDSGNLLCDSVSGTPVAFVQYSVAQKVFSATWTSFFANPTPQALAALAHSHARRVRILPASGIGEKETILYCLRPDWVRVNGEEKRLLLAITKPKAREFGGYCALLPCV